MTCDDIALVFLELLKAVTEIVNTIDGADDADTLEATMRMGELVQQSLLLMLDGCTPAPSAEGKS